MTLVVGMCGVLLNVPVIVGRQLLIAAIADCIVNIQKVIPLTAFTIYGLDGQGIDSRSRRYFPHLSRPTLRPTGSFRGVKRLGLGVDHPPHLAPRLKKEYSYTSTPPLGFMACYKGEFYRYFYRFQYGVLAGTCNCWRLSFILSRFWALVIRFNFNSPHCLLQ